MVNVVLCGFKKWCFLLNLFYNVGLVLYLFLGQVVVVLVVQLVVVEIGVGIVFEVVQYVDYLVEVCGFQCGVCWQCVCV